MRQRDDAQTHSYQSTPAVSPNAARAAAMRSTKHRSHVRGFVIGTVCFLVFVLVCLYGGRPAASPAPPTVPSSANANSRVTERDVAALQLATSTVTNATTLPNLEALCKTAAPVGDAYLALLERISAVDALESVADVLRKLDVRHDYLTSVATALRLAADVTYTKLKAMLLQEPNAQLAMAPTSLVRTTYGWMLCDLFLYSAVLPDYYLLEDDTPAHATVLLRTLNLLSWSPLVHTEATKPAADIAQLVSAGSVRNYDIFNWSGGAACRKAPLGAVSKVWMQFCESSFSSHASVDQRAAATYEELIALNPTYAPLRLHYAVVFTFLNLNSGAATDSAPLPLSEHAMKALRVIRNDREKLGVRYLGADAVHAPLLALLESYLTPLGTSTVAQQSQLVDALGKLKSCEHVKASMLSASQWQLAGVKGEYRPPVLTAEQMRLLMAKAQAHLGAGHTALLPFAGCL